MNELDHMVATAIAERLVQKAKMVDLLSSVIEALTKHVTTHPEQSHKWLFPVKDDLRLLADEILAL